MRTTPKRFGTRLQGKALAGDMYWERTVYTTPEANPCYFRTYDKRERNKTFWYTMIAESSMTYR